MPTFVNVFIGLFIAIGLGMLGFAYVSWNRATAAADWPTVSGRIIESNVRESSDSDGGSTWRAEIKYEYETNGRALVGERVAFGYSGSSSRSYHEGIAAALPVGAHVGVRVSPDDPSRATLATGMNMSIIFLAIFGTIWTIFSAGIWMLFALSGGGADKLLSTVIIYGR